MQKLELLNKLSAIADEARSLGLAETLAWELDELCVFYRVRWEPKK